MGPYRCPLIVCAMLFSDGLKPFAVLCNQSQSGMQLRLLHWAM